MAASVAALACALAARNVGRANPAQRGLEEALSFVQGAEKLGAVQQALKALPVRAEGGLSPVAYYDGKSITVDAGKAQLARDFDKDAWELCAEKETAERDRKLGALLDARVRRDVRLAGALVHEGRHRVDAERGVTGKARDERAAYGDELKFYRGLAKRAGRVELCATAGVERCAAAAAAAAREIEARAR